LKNAAIQTLNVPRVSVSVNRAAGIPGIVNPEIRPEGALARAGL